MITYVASPASRASTSAVQSAEPQIRPHPAENATALTSAPGLKRCIDYLTAKQPYLIYRIALTMGSPIATGVIEGACRYLPVN